MGELSLIVDQARAGGTGTEPTRVLAAAAGASSVGAGVAVDMNLQGNGPEVAAKTSYREFYNDVTRRLEQSGVGAASFFLNYGYVSLGEGDEAQFEVPAEVFNANSVRLAFELIGGDSIERSRGPGCGLWPWRDNRSAGREVRSGGDRRRSIPRGNRFCRSTHGHTARFEVGDAEHLPLEDGTFDVVTNVESSHTYPNLRAFLTEVRRVLTKGGLFLYTDLLPVRIRWAEVHMLLESLGMRRGK